MSNYCVTILSELLINMPLISSLASHINSHKSTGIQGWDIKADTILEISLVEP
jgi:hypothetical protein